MVSEDGAVRADLLLVGDADDVERLLVERAQLRVLAAYDGLLLESVVR